MIVRERRREAAAEGALDGRRPFAREVRASRRPRLQPAAPVSRRELAVALALLLALGAAAFGSHFLRGGFVLDDWSNAAKVRHLAACCQPGVSRAGAGYLDQAGSLLDDGPAASHLGLPVLVPIAHWLFGTHMSLHLALAVGLGALMSAAFYLLLRTLGIQRSHAGAMAALALIFPFSDSTRLWPMAGYNQVAVTLALLGLVVALHGLRARGRRSISRHCAALALYALGVLTYELAAGVVLVAAVFYVGRTTWRSALVRWLADVAVAAAALLAVQQATPPREHLDLALVDDHARLIADQALTLLGRAAVPFAAPATGLVLAVLVVLIALAAVSLRLLPRDDAARPQLRRWLTICGGGVLGVAAGYLLILPAPYGFPLDRGIENRVNMLAALGFVATLYSVAVLAGVLAGRVARRSRIVSFAVPALASAFLAAGYVDRLGESKAAYADAYAAQVRVLEGLERAVEPPEGSTIFTFGHPTFSAPGVPIFAFIWDLNSAVKLYFDDPSLGAHPVLPKTTFFCGPTAFYPYSNGGFNQLQSTPYGRAIFVDVATGRAEPITSTASCQAQRRRFRPGPLKAGSDCQLLGWGPGTRLGWQCGRGGPPAA